MGSNDETGAGLQPLVDIEQLTIGSLIAYYMLPEDNPTDPERLWRGRILSTTLLVLDVVWVESLEEGHEGDKEYVLLEQIIGIERERDFWKHWLHRLWPLRCH